MTLTDTPAFRRWFGKSKVVGKGQQPLVVYHGTVGDFTAFDPTRSGSKAKTGAPHGSFFFSDRADVAASYTVEWSGDFSERHYEGGTVLPVYLRIEKPLKVNAKGETWRDIEFKGEIVTTNDLATYAQRHGYDGVIVSNVIDKGRGRVEKAKATVYIALNPTQIKSATGNRGTFDPADPDIRHNPATARRNPYDAGKKYSGNIPEVRYLPVSVIYRREYDFKPETLSVSDEVARGMDYSKPIEVTAYRFASSGWTPTSPPRAYRVEEDDDETAQVMLEDGHHRLAAAIQTGRRWLPVNLTAINAKGEKLNALIALSQQIEAQPNPKTAKRTHPSLWNRIVAEVTAGDKGGRPGQWSARKAQLAVALYQKRGGGYIGPKSADNALAKWTQEQWRTRSGRPSLVTGERYLPTKALAALSPQEYGATTRAKRAGMASGQQFVPQPERIAMKTSKYRKNPTPPESLVEEYSYGRCMWLALAFHQRYGWPITAEVDVLPSGERYVSHSWVTMPDGREVDIFGPQTKVDRFGGREIRVSPREMLNIVGETSNVLHAEVAAEIARADEVIDRYLLSGLGIAQKTARYRKARRNPNYPNVSVYRGVLTSPEGRIPVKQIGKGQFSVAYLSEEPRPRVFLFTSGDVQDKEILMFAHDRLPNNPHLPAVEAYGDTRDGKTVWTMPLYKAPLKKADNETAWKQYLALKRCREALYKPRGVKSGYQVNYDVYECAIAAGVSPKLANALEHLLSTAADYDSDYVFEFSPRNLATDAEGNLVLLDVLYHRAALFRKLGAATARGF